MEKHELEIIALSHSVTQSHSFAVVLGEVNGNRRLPIVIGGPEAQAIAVALEKMEPSRPLTHDLLKNVIEEFGAQLKAIVINNLVEGIFYAQLICEIKGETVEIDSRTSDAIALAVRFGCPIYTYEFIMDEAGITVEDAMEEKDELIRTIEEKEKRKARPGSFKDYSMNQLEELLTTVLNEEDYEQAAKIRDEINRRRAT